MSEWDQPLVSVDVVAVRRDAGMLSFALCERKLEPFAGRSALPGVLLLTGEGLADAAKRAVVTKLELPTRSIRHITQFGAFDGTNRDPRGATISIGHLCAVDAFAGSATWTPIDAPPSGLPFDHDAIVAASAAEISRRLWVDMTFTQAVIGPEFTTSVILAITRQARARLPDTAKNMARWLRSNHHAESTGLRGRDTVWRWGNRASQ
jgi:ADP-ribose pyrophosphatase YjhB (NUDIX family)